MVTDYAENWYYFAVKSISRLLKGITSNHNGDFSSSNCFHSYRTKERLKKHEKICKDHDYCCAKRSDKDLKILKYNPGGKPLEVSFMIYADLKCLLGKIDTCQNDPKKSYTEKKSRAYAFRLLMGYTLFI